MKRAILTIIFLLFCTPLMGAGREVAFPGAKPGIIYVRTAEKRLYFTLPGERAMVYPIAVGKQGRQWTGESFVSFKTLHPTWKPPEMVRKDKPNLPELIGPGPKTPPWRGSFGDWRWALWHSWHQSAAIYWHGGLLWLLPAL